MKSKLKYHDIITEIPKTTVNLYTHHTISNGTWNKSRRALTTPIPHTLDAFLERITFEFKITFEFEI